MNSKKAKDLREGDTLFGSGFVVTHNAWSGVRTPKGKVNVEGYYPTKGGRGESRTYVWNANTTVSIY